MISVTCEIFHQKIWVQICVGRKTLIKINAGNLGHFKAKFFPKIVTRKKSQKQLASDCWVEISACKIPICLQGCSSVKLSYLQSSQWRNTFHVFSRKFNSVRRNFSRSCCVAKRKLYTILCLGRVTPKYSDMKFSIRSWNLFKNLSFLCDKYFGSC